MLFSSLSFILVFLPLTLAAVLLGRRIHGSSGARFALTAASLVFYGLWGWKLLPVLVVVAAANYRMSLSIFRTARPGRKRRLAFGIAANLLALIGFKYTNFLIDNVNAVTGLALPLADIAFPIGISFFTLQQVGYLVAVADDMEPPRSFWEYLLFVSCFAYVTAGPIVGAREFFSQRDQIGGLTVDRFVLGVTVFAIGLLKKVIIAETFAPYANYAFDQAQKGGAVATADAWLGSWCYFLQLYFDFSGYSEMALGLGVLLGLRLPLNFNSPLRAKSAIEFWQRWHMTLTRFLTGYLFMPLSVWQARRLATRKAGRLTTFIRVYAMPVTVTFVLAGLWHGANWTFVVFGAWWGIALAVNHGWRQARLASLPGWLAWAVTMLGALVGMVMFRSPDLHTCAAMLYAMAGAGPSTASQLMLAKVLAMILLVTAACLLAPNTPQVMDGWNLSVDSVQKASGLLSWRWRLNAQGLAFSALVIIALVIAGERATPFLYYQF